jgi:hypothetical protein
VATAIGVTPLARAVCLLDDVKYDWSPAAKVLGKLKKNHKSPLPVSMKSPIGGWQVSANFCQDRCRDDLTWCKKFTWYPEKGPTGQLPGACWLFTGDAVEIQNNFTSVSGPPKCEDENQQDKSIVAPTSESVVPGVVAPTQGPVAGNLGSDLASDLESEESNEGSGPVWPWLLVGLVCVLAVIGGGIAAVSFMQKKGEKKKTRSSTIKPPKDNLNDEKRKLVEEPPLAFPLMAPQPPPSYTPIQTAVSPIPMFTAVPVNTLSQGGPLIMAPAVRSEPAPLQQAQVVPLVWAQEAPQPTVMAPQPLVRNVQATPMLGGSISSPVLGGSIISPVQASPLLVRAGT